ncbi:MAG: FitA-like ribbon-helix-helix domain-containing protein [Desulfobacterales bacterium]
MRSISLRNVPDDVYLALQAMAKANRRSLQEQIKHLLEQEVRIRKGSSLAAARRWRRRLERRTHTDSVTLVREDRER